MRRGLGSVRVCEAHEDENELLEWAEHLGSTRLRAGRVGTGRGSRGPGKSGRADQGICWELVYIYIRYRNKQWRERGRVGECKGEEHHTDIFRLC